MRIHHCVGNVRSGDYREKRPRCPQSVMLVLSLEGVQQRPELVQLQRPSPSLNVSAG